MRLIDFFEDFYEPLQLLGKAKNTKRLYRYSIKTFSKFLGRHATLDDFNDLLVSKYLQSLLESELSPHSVRKERSQLIAIWNFAAKRRDVDRFPTVAQIKAPESAPVAWTMSQMKLLAKSCKSQTGFYNGVPAADWWLAIHCVIWDSGERIGAVLQLRWDQVSLPWINFKAETRKGGIKVNTVRVSETTAKALERIANPPRTLVFEWPYSETYIYRTYNQILSSVDLPTDAKSKFHRMRKSVATHYSAAGHDPQKLLKHTNRSTTERYLDPRIDTPIQASDVLKPFGEAG